MSLLRDEVYYQFTEAEDYTTAIELLQQSLDKNPKNANAWNYMGYSLRNLKRYDEALAAYEKAARAS